MARWKKEKEKKKRKEKGKPGRTGTNCDSQRGRGTRCGNRKRRKSEEFRKDRKGSLVPKKGTGKVP